MKCVGVPRSTFRRPYLLEALAVFRSDVEKPERKDKDGTTLLAELTPYTCKLDGDGRASLRARLCCPEAEVPWHASSMCAGCRDLLSKEAHGHGIEQRAERAEEMNAKLSVLSSLLAGQTPEPDALRLASGTGKTKDGKAVHWSKQPTVEKRLVTAD